MPAKKKTPEPATDGIVWRTTYTGPGAAPSGTPIRIGIRDLSVQRLREAKAFFGERYGIPSEYLRLLLLNECDAVAVAVWIGLQKAGRPVQDPRELDFNLDEHFEPLEDPQPAAGESKPDPTPASETAA